MNVTLNETLTKGEKEFTLNSHLISEQISYMITKNEMSSFSTKNWRSQIHHTSKSGQKKIRIESVEF